jgi:hypothetical protein
MPRNEGQHEVVAGGPALPDLFGKALDRVEEAVAEYDRNLRHTARLCAQQDSCETVQIKHVRHAEDTLSRLGPASNSIGDNPPFWWLLSALCFALGLAIPDTGMLYLGASEGQASSRWWPFLKVACATLLICGLLFSLIGQMIALGPHQPKWFKLLKRGLCHLAFWRRG